MTKISTYVVDEKVTALDKWIGSDANMQNRTKNFTPKKLAAYFNEDQVINIGTPLQYKYYTLDPLEARPNGTLTFETEIGPTVNFSSITTFLLSKYTTKQNIVSDFLNFLDGSKVLLFKSSDINSFGFYRISSLEPYEPDPNFFVVTVAYETGNGALEEDEDYMISLVSLAGDFIPTKTSELINDGDDGVNPFISELDINRTEWDEAYDGKINSAEVTGTTTKTLTLTKQDGGTIEASWTDSDTGLTSVGVSMPTAFSVANSPLTSNGTINITGAGTSLEYIKGDGTLGVFPTLTGYIPYTGATQDVDLGTHQLKADNLAISTTSAETVDVGEIVWNSIDGTFDMGLVGGVTLQAGQELHMYGKATEAISNGQAVMFAGVQGDHILIAKADAATINVNPEYLIGIATQDFVNNQFGYVTVFGNVRGLDTTGYTLGSVLYYNSGSSTDGLLTATTPTAPNAKIIVAAVVRVHATQGILLVRPHTMPKLKDLQDVYAPSPSSNNGLFWNSSTLRYENNSIIGALGYTPYNATNPSNYITLGSISSTATGITYTNTTGIFSLTSGYVIPTTTEESNWNDAYIDRITSASAPLSISSNAISISQAGSTTNGYLTSADWDTFNSKQVAGDYITSLTGEATASGPGAASVTLNNASVTSKILSGVNITGGTILDTDTMLTAFGKLQNQINSLIGGSIYQGVWNANTNTPTLTSSVGTDGNYYIVNVAGSTDLNGITDWKIGDWAIFHGGTWQKVDNTDAVSSVNGFTGAVSLATDSIPEGTTNLYFTNSRVSANTDVAANTASRHNSVSIGTANGLSLSNQVLSLGLASTSTNGALSSTDWNTFNGKQAALSGTGFVKASGTTISYDNSTYALDNTVVKLTGDQTISGVKTFSNPTIFNSSLNIASGAYSILYNPANSAYWQTYVDSSNVFNFGYNGNIVKASISNSGNFTANSFIKSGGTSSQFLKADGSVDSSTYALTSQLHDAVTLGTTGVLNGLSLSGQVLSLATASSTTRGALTAEDYSYFFGKQNALTNPITGTGTTNYLPKFTGASAIGNSLIYDDGTNIGIGTTSPDQKLTVEGNIRAGGVGNGFLLDTLGVNYTNGMKVVNNYETVMFSGRGSSGYVIAGDNNLRFGFGTNYSAGESMRITSGGNVGIGTSSPNEKLQVLGNIRLTNNNLTTANTLSSEINNYNGSTNQFKSSSIKFLTGTYVDQGHITFNTSISGVDQERVRIAETGNVGIGTTSPSTLFHIYKASFPILTIQSSSYQSSLGIDTTSGNLVLNNESNAPLSFNTNATERMRITSGGNVGIGTTSPAVKLDVNGTGRISSYLDINYQASAANGSLNIDSADPTIRFRVSGGTANKRIYELRAIAAGGTNDRLELRTWNDAQNAASSLLSITNGGNVGIGTTSPAYKFDLNSNAGGISFKTYTSTTNNSEHTYSKDAGFFIDSYQSVGGAPYTKTTDLIANADAGADSQLRMFTATTGGNPTERMRITSGGNVGIGTSSPAVKFHSYGGALSVGDESSYSARFSNNSNKGVVIGYDSTNNKGHIGSINPAVAWTDLILNANGGNVGIGTTSPGGKLHVVGEGIFDDGTNGRLTFANASSQNDIYSTTTSFGGWKNLRLSSNELILSSGGTTERMRITSGGNVGIGTTSPAEKLDVAGNGSFGISGGINNSKVAVLDASIITKLQSQSAGDSAGVVGTESNNDFKIITNNTERMRITSGGNVGIGTTSPNYKLSVLSSNNVSWLEDTSGASGAVFALFSAPGNTGIGSIARVGTTSAIAYNSTSDYRLKEDLKEVNGLDKISKIKIYDFKWKNHTDRMDGVIAHELQEVVPYAVTGEKDAEQMQSVDYSKLVPILVKAIQELKAEIEILKNK